MTRVAAVAVCVVAGLATASPSRGDDVSERMYRLAAPLTNLTASVEAAVRYKNLPPDVDGDRLLDIATSHDRRLLAPFAQYIVRVQRQGQRAVVLVCSPKRKVALFEDTGCSTKPDRHHWRSGVIRSCEFTLHAEAVCVEHAAHRAGP
jgi:hypothetical protein